jgi:hypothetical protein
MLKPLAVALLLSSNRTFYAKAMMMTLRLALAMLL